jgi:hypothetical protein
MLFYFYFLVIARFMVMKIRICIAESAKKSLASLKKPKTASQKDKRLSYQP